MLDLQRRVQPLIDNPYHNSEFMDYFYRDCSVSIVQIGCDKYYVKYCRSSLDAQKSLLACTLASPIMNIPSIILPDPALKVEIDDVFKARSINGEMDTGNAILVRLCQNNNSSAFAIWDVQLIFLSGSMASMGT